MRRPRIKPILHPYRLAENRIRIGGYQYGVGSDIDDDDGHVWQLLQLMDGTRSADAIVAGMLSADADLDEDSVRDALQALVQSGFVEDAGAPDPPELSASEIDRYSRNARYFAWIDTSPRPSTYEVQLRLKRARVTIVGLGGTGSSIAVSLVAAGVGNLHCIDCDLVEESNLTRQILYCEDDIGQPKVDCAVARLRRINRHVEVTGQNLRVRSPADFTEAMIRSDLVVLSADEPPLTIQDWANHAALRARTPWLVSYYAGPMMVVGIFVPFETPCWRCFRHAEEHRGTPPEPDRAMSSAVIAPAACLAGNLAALEVIYFLGGLKPQTVGVMYHQNLMVYDHAYRIEAVRRPDCSACGEAAQATNGD